MFPLGSVTMDTSLSGSSSNLSISNHGNQPLPAKLSRPTNLPVDQRKNNRNSLILTGTND